MEDPGTAPSPTLPAGYRVETVRGRIEGALAAELIDFWSGHGALAADRAGERLPEVVSVMRDPGGAIAAVNSVFAARVPEVGNRCFWRYRTFAPPPEVPGAFEAMLVAARNRLRADYVESKPEELEARGEWVAARFNAEPGSENEVPIGLCVIVFRPGDLRAAARGRMGGVGAAARRSHLARRADPDLLLRRSQRSAGDRVRARRGLPDRPIRRGSAGRCPGGHRLLERPRRPARRRGRAPPRRGAHGGARPARPAGRAEHGLPQP